MATTLSNLDDSSNPRANPVREVPRTITHGPEVSASPSDPAMLRRLYSTMLRCRMIEQSMLELAQSRKLDLPIQVEVGNEATDIGSMIELRPGDAVSSQPSVAAHVISGMPLGLLFAEMLQLRAEYLAFAPEAASGSIHIIPPTATIAGQLNMAAGFALAHQAERRPNVVLVHLPDGFNALGFWHEAATMAVAQRLPIILVARRDLKGPTASGRSELRDRASAYGIPGITVDGDDVVAMWRVTQESIYRARGGAGPTLIDGERVDTHSDSTKSGSELDPLSRMQHYLDQRNHWDDTWKRELAQKFKAEIAEAQGFLRKTSRKQ